MISFLPQSRYLSSPHYLPKLPRLVGIMGVCGPSGVPSEIFLKIPFSEQEEGLPPFRKCCPGRVTTTRGATRGSTPTTPMITVVRPYFCPFVGRILNPRKRIPLFPDIYVYIMYILCSAPACIQYLQNKILYFSTCASITNIIITPLKRLYSI